MDFKYPYTDFHELNLDWFLARFKELVEEWNTLSENNATFKHDMELAFSNLDSTVQTFTSFVTHYFDNLDVQQEINNKLNTMYADGSLKLLVEPIFDEYMASTNSRMDTLESRMDAFASLTEGSTTGDAELMDIRVAGNGCTFPTAGDATRGQYKIVDDKNALIIDPVNKFTSENSTISSYINADTGAATSNPNYNISDAIPVSPYYNYKFKVYTGLFGSTKARVISFYDSSDNRITSTGVITDGIISVKSPANAVTMKVTYAKTDIDTFMIVENAAYPDHFIPYNEVHIKDDVKLPPLYINIDDITQVSFKTPVNLYDPDDEDIVTGYYIDYNGALHEESKFKASGYIPIVPGKTYIYPAYPGYFGNNNSNILYASYYDRNKNFINSQRIDDVFMAADRWMTRITFTNTAARYTRVNIAIGQNERLNNKITHPQQTEGNFMYLEADSVPEYFRPYGNIHKFTGDFEISKASANIYNKSVVFLGDSICEGDSGIGYAGRIGAPNAMFWYNQGFSGSTISVQAGHANLVNRDIGITDPDYIIIEGGTNDADVIGNITGGTYPAAFGTFDPNDFGTNDPDTDYGFDKTTFIGAIDYLCKKLITAYPSAKMGYIIAHKMGVTTDYTVSGNNRRAYFDWAEKVFKKWGIRTLNLWDGCCLNPKLPIYYTVDDPDNYYKDGQHLTANGYNYISPIIESWMNTL